MKIVDKSIGSVNTTWIEGDVIRAIYSDDPDKQFAYFLVARLDDPSGTGNSEFFLIDLSDGTTSEKYSDVSDLQKESELLGSRIVKAKLVIEEEE